MWGRAGLSLGFQDVLQVGEIGFHPSLPHADNNRVGQPEQALHEAACLPFADEAQPCAALNGLEGIACLD